MMTKSQAGRLGGLSTVKRHGKQHMAEIGRKGAEAFHKLYRLEPISMNDFAIIDRATNKPLPRTLNGELLEAR